AACGCVHDPFRCGHRGQCPLGPYSSRRIKLPYLVCRAYVDVEPAQDVQLVVSHCKPTRENGSHSPRPVVSSEGGRSVCRWIVGDHASCPCGSCSERAASAIDQRRPRDGEHATSHVVHRIVGQCRRHLGPSAGRGVELEHVLEVRAYRIRGTATHGVEVAIVREENANRSDKLCGQGRPGRPTPGGRSWFWRRFSAGNEIELTDAGVPVAALGILVDMPEVHAGGGIDLCPRIITPAGAASLGSDSRKHDGFSLRKVTWRVTDETSGVPNRRDDCRVGSGVT